VKPGFYGRARELEQTYLNFACAGLAQDHVDRYALYVLNTIVGGSMSSRLFQEVREKRGLAYSVFSSHAAYRDAGIFTSASARGPTRRRGSCGSSAASWSGSPRGPPGRRRWREPATTSRGISSSASNRRGTA